MSSGTPGVLVLRPRAGLAGVKAVSATLALAKRHMTLLKAKRAVEALLAGGEAVAHVPMVESLATLVSDLDAAGVRATRLATAAVDVRAIRERLRLSQEQFALRYNLDLGTIQNWEQGRSQPDRGSANYLRVIAVRPREAAAAQEEGTA